MGRNGSGYLVEDPKKFPNGLKHVADYIHARRLKFGQSPAVRTPPLPQPTDIKGVNLTRDISEYGELYRVI